MSNFIDKLRQLVRLASKSRMPGRGTNPGETPAMREVLNGDVIQQLMRMIENTHEDEYSCEETYAVLDEYVEMVVSQEDAAALMPLVRRHIDMCVDCRDEYEALMRTLQGGSFAGSV